MPRRLFGSRNFALFERWVHLYSLRVLPAIWFGGLILALVGAVFRTDPLLRDRLFILGSGGAVLALAVWMLLTGIGVVWLIPRSFFIKDADRGLGMNLVRFLLFLTGVMFLALGVVLARLVAPHLLDALHGAGGANTAAYR